MRRRATTVTMLLSVWLSSCLDFGAELDDCRDAGRCALSTGVDGGSVSTDGGGSASTDGGGSVSTDGGGRASTDGGGRASTDGGGRASTDGGGRASTDGGGSANGGTSDAGRHDGGGQPGSGGGTCVPGLAARFRDFKDTHPDFEKFSGSGATTGLVQSSLDADNLPVYAPPGSTNVTSGKANFDQWYRDAPDVNQGFDRTILLSTDGDGRWVFDSNAFFPIDNLGFGNQGRDHNFHFTTEIRASFVYQSHEVLTFRGDDDVWVFVNHRLALDLGGLHSALEGSIDFDALASELNITVGTKYALDIFHAERHTSKSNFRVETTIECLVP